MKITLMDTPDMTTITIDVKGCSKDNLKEYAKRLERYIHNGSIYPWYNCPETPFVLIHTGSFVKSKTGEPFKEAIPAFGFIQNAINEYESNA